MTRAEQLKKVIQAPGDQELIARKYRAMRKRHAWLSMQEHKTVTGQGCSDTYPAGYPV